MSKDEMGAGERVKAGCGKQFPVTSSIQAEAGQQFSNIKEQI